MKNIVRVKDVAVGEGIPKICVPIAGRTEAEILSQAERVKQAEPDMAEWRADWYEEVFDSAKIEALLPKVQKVLGNIPLLFTFRTGREGGERAIEPDTYEALNRAVLKSGCVDLIDIELYMGEELVLRLIEAAHQSGVKTVISNHDFEKTPDRDALLSRMRKMHALGGDISKIAVMPQSSRDVMTLLDAAQTMKETCPEAVCITIAMSGLGLISRIGGEIFGSALTFASVGACSAPGQIEVQELRSILRVIHNNSRSGEQS